MPELPRESAVKPLAGTTKQNRPYARPPEVEAEIEAVLEWPLPQAIELAAEGKLRPQSLVYLMRNCKPNRPTPQYDSLVVAFFSRLQRAGDRLTWGMSELDRETVDGLVTDKALQFIKDDRLDVFEMSFRLGAERLYFTAIDHLRRQRRIEVSREDLIEPDTNQTGEEAADALAVVEGPTPMPLAEAKAALQQVLQKLNENERRAIFYRYRLGLTEEEAAAQMGCSDRNVRYLIESARHKALGEAGSANAKGAQKRAKR